MNGMHYQVTKKNVKNGHNIVKRCLKFEIFDFIQSKTPKGSFSGFPYLYLFVLPTLVSVARPFGFGKEYGAQDSGP
jgi:hypothetical protein